MKNFLPDGYEAPKQQGNYMKLEDGANKFRVLSSAIVGYEYWTAANACVRSRTPFDQTPADIRMNKDGKPERVKHFWAFVVWNYATENVQILELTQASIQGPINDLVRNEEWGDPHSYDITINRKGEGLDTEYSVQPSPHKAVAGNITAAYEKMKVNLDALFEGGNPFEASEDAAVDRAMGRN